MSDFDNEEQIIEENLKQDGSEMVKKSTPQKDKKTLSPAMREFLSWVRVILIAVAIALFLTKVVIINATVPSSSMENTIMTGDRLFGFRLQYKLFGDPQRGDIIIFKYPVDESENFIKRVIGLPGETVTIRDAKIYIDDSDTPLEEPYLPEEWVDGNDGFYFEVPENCYFVLGDNRNVSHDARYWAWDAYTEDLADTEEEALQYSFVHRDKILGKAFFRYWPFNQMGGL